MSRFSPTALMLGNIVTGTTILAPAGMLSELSRDLDVSIREASFLMTFGAIVLCIGSPLTAWLTSRIDRRLLLGTSLAVMLLGNLASAFASSLAMLMVLRLVTLAIASLYTPQAAGTVGLITPPEQRGGTISYVFLGWSIAAAAGLPLVAYVSSHYGWRVAFAGISVLAALSLLLLMLRLPRGLTVAPIDLRTWAGVLRNPLILLLLAITSLQIAGQFSVFTFMSPLFSRLTGASAETIAIAFAIYGVMGFVGNIIAARLVDTWGPYRSSLLWMSALLAGVVIWAIGAGNLAAMIAGVAVWGLGFAAMNSMQQVRLVAAAPAAAGASASLNTSVLYIGQGVGSAIGGALFAREMFGAIGYAGVALTLMALVVLLMTRRR